MKRHDSHWIDTISADMTATIGRTAEPTVIEPLLTNNGPITVMSSEPYPDAARLPTTYVVRPCLNMFLADGLRRGIAPKTEPLLDRYWSITVQ